MGLLGSILKVAAPVAGFALGGPAGAMLGAGVSGAIGGAENEAKQNKLMNQANQIKQSEYNQLAPARSKSLSLLLNAQPNRPQLGSLFGADTGNPYMSRYRPVFSGEVSRNLFGPSPLGTDPMGSRLLAGQSPLHAGFGGGPTPGAGGLGQMAGALNGGSMPLSQLLRGQGLFSRGLT